MAGRWRTRLNRHWHGLNTFVRSREQEQREERCAQAAISTARAPGECLDTSGALRPVPVCAMLAGMHAAIANASQTLGHPTALHRGFTELWDSTFARDGAGMAERG